MSELDARRSDRDRPAAETGEPDDFATAGQRAVAYVIDAGVVLGALLALTRRWEPVRRVAAIAVGALVGATAYHVVLEGSRGQTAGKRAVGVAVVGADGGPCSYRAAAVRTAARVADFLPVGYLLGLLSIRVTRRRQRLGDLIAGTVVVETEADTYRAVTRY